MGKSLEELKNIPTSDKLNMKVIEVNIDQIGDHMKIMKLGDRNVEVTKYPPKADVQLMHNTMKEYDPKYEKSIRDKKKQSNMKIIDQILRCPKHTKVSDYSLEFKMYGEI